MPLFRQVVLVIVTLIGLSSCSDSQSDRRTLNFNTNWEFTLSANSNATSPDSSEWRTLNLPHDWSIEGKFDSLSPAGVGGGALSGGLGWYRKSFQLPRDASRKNVFIQFDGVYQNSTVWLNGNLLGTRPNGYISFQYKLTPFLNWEGTNEILVKVDNSQQPNSRWYSGSGIYRDVRLVIVNPIHIEQWGTYITTPTITETNAEVNISTTILNQSPENADVTLVQKIFNKDDQLVLELKSENELTPGKQTTINQIGKIPQPILWSLENPHLYTLKTSILLDGNRIDNYETYFGVRSIDFNSKSGFTLNGTPTKIKGVCLHHDLGCLGAAFNTHAMNRQLRIMKDMGVNAIRTAHNPPAPAVLDLCDEMGILVMDEMFDMWSKKKSEFDYSQYWEEWHEQDLKDFIMRDRNHPSIIAWSVGNEIIEQYDHSDTLGSVIASELVGIVKELDATRPVTTANNDTSPDNPLIKSGSMDLIGYNYHHEEYPTFPNKHPNKSFIATETNSALATRGHYEMPSDSIKMWPIRWDLPFTEGNPDNTVSAYDHVHAPWGSTQEATWDIVKQYDFISGMFIWTGFDYLGEPTPYGWPSRSSYFGLVDLAGFPKDTYYMYQSEWTEEPVLHLYPHWNWEDGQVVDVWAYYSQADQVELFLNGKSLGVKSKEEGQYHVMWSVPFEPGELRAVSSSNGEKVLEKTIRSATAPHQIELLADRSVMAADGYELAFVTLKILDEDGNLVPYANDLIELKVEGAGILKGIDNGDPVSHRSFKDTKVNAFHGLALTVLQSAEEAGTLRLKASAQGLQGAEIVIDVKNYPTGKIN